MSRNKGYGKFVLGAAIGAGLGLLLAPKKGEDLRKDLKVKLDELVKQAKDIDVEEVKKEFNRKVEDIKMGLVDLDKEKAKEIARDKATDLKNKAQELVFLATEKGTPVLKKTANDVLEKVIQVSKETQKKLAKDEKKEK